MKMQSDELYELATALVAAQEEMNPAKKSSTNPFFKSKYEDLAESWCAAQEVLPKNGLAVSQTTELIDGQFVLKTTLLHKSGQFISGVLPISNTQDPQKMGGWITYARRYALQAILPLPTADDDAESLMDRKKATLSEEQMRGFEFDFQTCTSLNDVNLLKKKLWDKFVWSKEQTEQIKSFFDQAQERLT